MTIWRFRQKNRRDTSDCQFNSSCPIKGCVLYMFDTLLCSFVWKVLRRTCWVMKPSRCVCKADSYNEDKFDQQTGQQLSRCISGKFKPVPLLRLCHRTEKKQTHENPVSHELLFLSHAHWRRRGIPVQNGGSYRSWSGKSWDAPVGRSPGDVFSGAWLTLWSHGCNTSQLTFQWSNSTPLLMPRRWLKHTQISLWKPQREGKNKKKITHYGRLYWGHAP